MACFSLINISRLFKQLCQYQAHAVNHQPTKCRTPDFYNRQNGTSWESGTFPIKKQQKQKTCFPALFSEGWANHELLSLSARQIWTRLRFEEPYLKEEWAKIGLQTFVKLSFLSFRSAYL